MKNFILSILLLPALVILLIPIPFLASHRFILLSVVPILCFSYILLFKNAIKIQLVQSDIGWIAFIGFGFLSYFWATNGALVWFPSFGWLSVFLWMLLFRALCRQDLGRFYLSTYFSWLCLVILFYLVIITFSASLGEGGEWNKNFGYNANYIPIFLLSLWPFLWFQYRNTFISKLFRFISVFAVVFIVYTSKSRGASICFLFVIIFYYIRSNGCITKSAYLSLRNIPLFAFCAVSFFLMGYYFNIIELNFLEKVGDGNRLDMIYSSVKVFMENPFIGIGFGNWLTEAYQYSDFDIKYNYHPFTKDFPVNNHNIYSTYLAELGIVGSLLFIYPLVNVSRKFKNIKQAYWYDAFWISFFVYIIASFIYLDVNLYENYFSGIQLVAFCALGFLSKDDKIIYTLNKSTTFLFLILSLSVLGWFAFYQYTLNIYSKAIKLDKESDRYLEMIESIYYPVFKTTHGYYKGHKGLNRSLALELALGYEKINKYNYAEKYFKEALKYAPNDERVLINYSKFLLRNNANPVKAKKLLQHAYLIVPTNVDVNFLLAEFAIIEKNYKKARNYLNVRWTAAIGRWNDIRYLRQQLYSSNYLNSLVNLDKKQKIIFLNWQKNNQGRLSDYKFNSHLIYKNTQESEKLIRIIEKGDSELKYFLLNFLKEKQYLTYLKDNAINLYDMKLRHLYLNYSLTILQVDLLQDVFVEIVTQKECLTRRLNLPSVRVNEQTKFDYQKRIDSLSMIIDTEFASILSEKQYKQYKKDQIEKGLSLKLKQLNATEDFNEFKIAALKDILIEYEFNKSIINIDTLEIEKLQNKLYQSLNNILTEEQFIKYQKVFSLDFGQ